MVDVLLKVARGELGVKENPANSNKVKYNDWYYGRPVSGSAYPWCSVFVTWCFYHAGMLDLAFGSLNEARKAVAEGARNWKVLAENKKQWVTSGYQPGDVVVFDLDGNGSIDHVGIVELVTDQGDLFCIEGNTAVGNDSNGGEVMRRQRSTKLIAGAFRPAYPKSAEEITVDNAIADGVITERAHWLGVLTGTIKPIPEYIKTVFDRYHVKVKK